MNFARLKLPLLLRLGILFLPLADVALGQQAMPFVVEPPPNAVYPDFGPGNFAAARLRRQPAKMFTFDRAALRDVLRYLADDAGIPRAAAGGWKRRGGGEGRSSVTHLYDPVVEGKEDGPGLGSVAGLGLLKFVKQF